MQTKVTEMDVGSWFSALIQHGKFPRWVLYAILLVGGLAVLLSVSAPYLRNADEMSIQATAIAIPPTQTSIAQFVVDVGGRATAVAATVTALSSATPLIPTPTDQSSLASEFECNPQRNSVGVLSPSEASLQYLSDFKFALQPDQNSLNPEVTAGDASQNSIRVDLWWRDSQTPWGNREVSTLVRRGVSIRLLGNYAGTSFSYAVNSSEQGWTPALVHCETIAHLSRRIVEGNAIANVIYLKITDNQYVLAPYDQILRRADLSSLIWEGIGDSIEDDLAGTQGFVPLGALIDLGLVSIR